jgi:hypothetical protein
MTSPNRAAANRANALKSTGPRSAAGKLRSAQNAAKHGLTAATLQIKPGEQPLFDNFVTGLRRQFEPKGDFEELSFTEFSQAAWKLRSLRLAEARILAESSLLDDSPASTLLRFARYRTRSERARDKALKALQDHQTSRAFREMLPAETAEAIPSTANAQPILNRAEHPGPGFSIGHILRSADHSDARYLADTRARECLKFQNEANSRKR